MASLKDLKLYFEKGPHGRKMPLSELKDTPLNDRNELAELLDELPEDERV